MRILVWWLRSVKPKSIPPGPRSLIRLHNDSHDHHACGECVSEGQDYGYRQHRSGNYLGCVPKNEVQIKQKLAGQTNNRD